MTAKEQANLKFVLDWWRDVLQARHLELAPKYQAENYIQHNINVPTGRAGFVQFFGRPARRSTPIPDKLANPPVVQFAKGDFVVLVWEREGKDPADPSKTYKYNTYDMLRIENGKVQEHWDYAQKAKGGPTAARRTASTTSKVTFNHSAQEQKNLEIATVEFKDILQYGHVELAEKVMAPTYIQHNPNVPTGPRGVRRVLQQDPQARADPGRMEEQADADVRERLVRLPDRQADGKGSGRSEQDVSRLLVRHGARGQRHDPGTLGRGHEERSAGSRARRQLAHVGITKPRSTQRPLDSAKGAGSVFFVCFVVHLIKVQGESVNSSNGAQ